MATYPPHICNDLIGPLKEAVELGTINEQVAEHILNNCETNATLLVNTSFKF
tara:strand:- start:47 stop:202 length:156 start_codon:yes stop_codon:yes gene_type:complete